MSGVTARANLWLRRVLASLTGVVLFFMMAVTTVDVVARFAFASPLPGTFELMEFSLAIVVFSAMPLVTWDRGHITVSLFDGLFRGIGRHVQQAGIMAVSTTGMAIVSLRMWDQGDRLAETGATTGFLLWPRAPVAYFMSTFAGVATLVLVGLLVYAVLARPYPEFEDHHEAEF